MTTIYGIPNCDTMKKARKWLDEAGVEYAFHDYKKAGAPTAKLKAWAAEAGWEPLLNRSGTTFRKLPLKQKENINKTKALELMAENPSMIKRPVLETDDGLIIGFDADRYKQVFAG